MFCTPTTCAQSEEEEEEEGTHTPTHTEEVVAFNKAQGRHIIIHHFPPTYSGMGCGGDIAKTVLPVPRILDCDTYYVRVATCVHTHGSEREMEIKWEFLGGESHHSRSSTKWVQRICYDRMQGNRKNRKLTKVNRY